MTVLRDCTDDATWWPHVDEATRALAAGGLVVLPTDTVYGIAADAFKPEAVQALLDAKGRGRDMPPPVLIGDVRTMDGLADDIPDDARELATRFWPGPLTIILKAQPSLQWDLGETRGTVALRMPDHELALAVLKRTGPLAVSSANTSGSPAATTAQEAADMLGSSVRVYLDGGPAPGGVASTIVDATGPTMRIVRAGALSAEELGLADADEPDAEQPDAEEAGADGTADEAPADAGTTAAADADGTATDDAAADAAAAAAPKAPAPARTSRAKAGTAAATTKEGGETDAGEQPSAKPPRAPRKPRTTSGAAASGESGSGEEAGGKPARAPRKPHTTAAASEGSGAGDEAAARPVRARKPRPRADAVAQAAEAAEAEAAETSPAPRRARGPRTAPAAEETPVETPEP